MWRTFLMRYNIYLSAHNFESYLHKSIYSSFKNFCLFFAPGRKEGICPHEVPGAFESEGPRLSNPPEGSHCLGGHDGQTLLYRPGLSTPKGHMVRTSVFAALNSFGLLWPTVIDFREFYIKFYNHWSYCKLVSF